MTFLREIHVRELSPKDIQSLIKGFLRGTLYVVWYRYLKRMALIRFPFLAYAPVRIVGPGRVFIDERCTVTYNIHEGLTIVTLSPEARVSIGQGCDLGGLIIRCRNSVSLGDKVMTAACLIQDSILADGLSLSPLAERYRHDSDGQPISIGNHVWLSSMSAVLSGSVIGDESVLTVGSVAVGQETGEYQLLMGNPVRRKFHIENLLQFKGKPCRT